MIPDPILLSPEPFPLSPEPIYHVTTLLLSGKSTYGSRETELYSGARRMFRESRMCLQTIHYIYATKGEITGMIAPDLQW